MKNIFRFKGGIHPPENKLTASQPVETMPLPGRVVIPMAQHIGAPARPVVAKGDTVLAGQKIGEANGFVSVPVHASVSGTVKDIVAWPHPVLGKPVEAVVIESDGADARVEPRRNCAEYYRHPAKDLIAAVREAGIVGMGGATFPTHVKLSPPEGVSIDTVIINGAECEPYLTSDDRLMREHPRDVVEGAKILRYILSADRVVIAVEENKPAAVKALREIVFNEPNVDLTVMPTRYPQGAEKQLIKTVLKREIPSGGLPMHVGVVVDNVGTAYAVCRAVREGESLTGRIVTVSGGGIRVRRNLRVRVGTLVSDVAAFCGGTDERLAQLIMGGPMMGIAQASLDVPVLKGTSGLLFLTDAETRDRDYSNCFRCGKCARACPMGLIPGMMSQYAERWLAEEAQEYHPFDCIECGCCTYACPAGRPIVQHVKWVKGELNRKKQKAEQKK